MFDGVVVPPPSAFTLAQVLLETIVFAFDTEVAKEMGDNRRIG